MEVITKDMEEVKAYFEALERGTKYVDNVRRTFTQVMNGEVYLTGEEVCRILHITTRTLQDYRAATDYPVHCAAGQNAVPTIGLVAYAGRELCADEAKEQTKEKPYLTFGCGAWVNAGKGRSSTGEFLPLPCFALPDGIQAVSRMATACFLTFFCVLSRTFFCMAARLPEIERKSELTILLVTSAYIWVVLICL